MESRGAGQRLLAGAGVPDDTGAADPALTAALAAYAADPTREPEVLAALGEARLLVPVVAELGQTETGPDGLVHDKTSDMATVLMRGSDGRLALLAFTGLEPMQRWDPDARPVPVPAPVTAALAAMHGRRRGAADRPGRTGALPRFQLAPRRNSRLPSSLDRSVLPGAPITSG